jgi:23S rRNA (adenine2030-N6)-methyltransferase
VNYRHAFHAGNFADLVKHAGLLAVLKALEGAPSPLTIIDTHAGAGLYDLGAEASRRSGEAQQGVVRLMADKDAPDAFGALKGAVRDANPGGGVSVYPGSPWLIARALRSGDRYLACELRADDHRLLRGVLKAFKGAEALLADGYRTAAARTPERGRALVLIDPPFERADDYRRIVETADAVLRRRRDAALVIWLPLKDLETFDAFLRDLEDAVGAPGLVAEARLRPLADPMAMNGCALAILNPPPGIAAPLRAICTWVAETLGAGGSARVEALR